MNKNFTREDILKKHESNIKSAQTAFSVATVLGIIYLVRFFITGNLNFFFGLALPDLILKYDARNIFYFLIIAVYVTLYVLLLITCAKKPDWFKGCLAVYVFDFAVLLISMFVVFPAEDYSVDIINVIFHLFIILFLSVGIYSHKKIQK